LIAQRQKLIEALAQFESEKKKQASKGDDRAKKEYGKLFEKSGELNFEIDALGLEIARVEGKLNEVREVLKWERDMQRTRLYTYIKAREDQMLNEFTKSLPSLEQEVIDMYFVLCQKIAAIELVGSRFVQEVGGTTARNKEVSDFWTMFPSRLVEGFKAGGYICCPNPWPDLSQPLVRTYLKGSRDFASAVRDEEARRKEMFTKEFFEKENV
jgi:hypothetical protein